MAALTPNSLTNAGRVKDKLWPLRLPDATIEDDFAMTNCGEVLIFALRREDMLQSPSSFCDFNHAKPQSSRTESALQLYFKTIQLMKEAYYGSSPGANPGEHPFKEFVEVVLQPEGNENNDSYDRKSAAARQDVVSSCNDHYGPARFDYSTIRMQHDSRRDQALAAIRFMESFDHRRVFEYRFVCVMRAGSPIDFTKTFMDALELAAKAHATHLQGDPRRREMRGSQGGGGGGKQNDGGASWGLAGAARLSEMAGLSGGGGGGGSSGSEARPFSSVVLSDERWQLLHTPLLYINAVATYLRDESFMQNESLERCMSMQVPFSHGDNPACPRNIFLAASYFENTLAKQKKTSDRVQIDPMQLDLNNYYTVVPGNPPSITWRFPESRLVLRVPRDKCDVRSHIQFYLPEYQKLSVEPHLDLQPYVNGDVTRANSEPNSQNADGGNNGVNNDPDADVDDRLAPPAAAVAPIAAEASENSMAPDSDSSSESDRDAAAAVAGDNANNDDDDDDDDNDDEDGSGTAPQSRPMARRVRRRGDDSSAVDGAAALQSVASRSLDDDDDFSSAVTINGENNPLREINDEASIGVGRNVAAAGAAAVRRSEAMVERRIAAAAGPVVPAAGRGRAAPAADDDDGHYGPPIEVDPELRDHPRIAEWEPTLVAVFKASGVRKIARMRRHHVNELNVLYHMTGDFGDAQQYQMSAAIANTTDEGGTQRTEHHLMRQTVYHQELRKIEREPDEVKRTRMRLRMQFAAMDAYCGKCSASVSNVSQSLKMMNLFFENLRRLGPVTFRGDMRLSDPSLSLFGNSKIRFITMLDEVRCVYTAHCEVMAAITCASSAYRYYMGLRLHPLLYGPAGSSKSIVLEELEALSIPGTVDAVTSESAHAGDTDDNENDVVRIMHELPSAMASKKESEQHVLTSLKNHMTAGVSTRMIKEINNGVHSRRRLTSEKQIAFCACTNLDESMLDDAIRDRFILIHQVKKSRPDCTIDQKMAQRANIAKEARTMSDNFVINCCLTQYLHAHLEKCIMIGFISRISVVVTPLLLACYMETLSKRFGIRGNRRTSDKVLQIARQLTGEAAVRWLYYSPQSPVYGKEIDLWHLLLCEPMLKDSEEIALHALDMMRAQFINPDEEQLLYALRTWSMPEMVKKDVRVVVTAKRFAPVKKELLIALINGALESFRVPKQHVDETTTTNSASTTTTTTVRLVRVEKTIGASMDSNGNAIAGASTISQYHIIKDGHRLDKEYIATLTKRQRTELRDSLTLNMNAMMQEVTTTTTTTTMTTGAATIDAPTSLIGEMGSEHTNAATEYYNQRLIAAQNTAPNKGVIESLTDPRHVAMVELTTLLMQDDVVAGQKSASNSVTSGNTVTDSPVFDYQYWHFEPGIEVLARHIFLANRDNGGHRELDLGQCTKLIRKLTDRKIVSHAYRPNPYNHYPPVVVDDDSPEQSYDAMKTYGSHSGIFIHVSLVFGNEIDPHEEAIQSCINAYTPFARYVSALPHDGTTPHVLKVRDVRPSKRIIIPASIINISSEARTQGLARELAAQRGVEDEQSPNFARDLEEDEDAARHEESPEERPYVARAMACSLDKYATFVHLKSIGMPCTERNLAYFTSFISDRLASERPECVVPNPFTYPDRVLERMRANTKAVEESKREFANHSALDVRHDRARLRREGRLIEPIVEKESVHGRERSSEERALITLERRTETENFLVNSDMALSGRAQMIVERLASAEAVRELNRRIPRTESQLLVEATDALNKNPPMPVLAAPAPPPPPRQRRAIAAASGEAPERGRGRAAPRANYPRLQPMAAGRGRRRVPMFSDTLPQDTPPPPSATPMENDSALGSENASERALDEFIMRSNRTLDDFGGQLDGRIGSAVGSALRAAAADNDGGATASASTATEMNCD